MYYFDFFHKNEIFNSMLYANGSDVEVGVLEYNKLEGQNFLDQVTNPNNYIQKFIYKSGDVPRKRETKAKIDKNSHYVISMKPLDDQAIVYFTIYDKTKPLIAPTSKKFKFAVDESDEQIF